MDFDFPAPYDKQVPYAIGKARQELSEDGLRVLEMLIAGTAGLEDVVAEMETLPQRDLDIVTAMAGLFQEAYDAKIQENQGWVDFAHQAQSVIRRAQALDPELAALGDEATTGRAVEVLKRHGEAPGISDEALETKMEVPPEIE